ncbi:NAD(P)/FAD-dependent oxidoreductase [Actinomadura litoris]|uniref:NAD(P)/FAD-dependent oxidoreductase n=1 Tax=Actinomadura litoris TaxID=2678616 RepID=UPI001C12AD76|nr:NAD(P)/FAD-dependent oxidoreductase [Actinomadura litoris]
MFVVNVPRQASDLAARLGCAAFADGCVEVDEFGRTSVPMPLSAVVAAAASGTVAAAVLDQDLVCADFDLPHPFAKAGG